MHYITNEKNIEITKIRQFMKQISQDFNSAIHAAEPDANDGGI